MWLYFIISFLTTVIFLYIFYKVGGFGKYVDDHNKPEPRKVLVGGGLVVIIITSILYVLFGRNYGFAVYGIVGMLIIALILGLYDDIKGIRKWKKVPILAIASIPIIAAYIISGKDLWEPIVFSINFFYLYWFLVIPIVVAGFANGGNVLGGYDGMETGIYSLISLLYLFIGFLISNQFVIFLSGIILSSLLGMLIFNWYPSKLLLGNVGSFAISALLGIIPLIGYFEIVLPVVFLPHIIEVILQLKYTRKYRYDVFGEVDKNGIIHNKYGSIKSIVHWIISWGDMTEKKITLAMLGIESLLCVIAFFVWYAFYIFA